MENDIFKLENISDVNINENFLNRQSPKSQSSLRNLYDHSLSYLKN
jgi:hypothetical protein